MIRPVWKLFLGIILKEMFGAKRRQPYKIIILTVKHGGGSVILCSLNSGTSQDNHRYLQILNKSIFAQNLQAFSLSSDI